MSLEIIQLNKDKKPASECRLLSLGEFCRELSITVATGKNWIKSGRIEPTVMKGKSPFFDEEYLKKIKESIKNGDNTALKKRRNKKYISGNSIYNSYLPEESVNASKVGKLIEVISEKGIEITDSVISAVMADCAVQMITDKNGCEGNLKKYLTEKSGLFGLEFLIDDLLTGNEMDVIREFPELFGISYVYETSADVLGFLYMSLKNMSSRKLTGAYYTPTLVVKKLVDEVFSDCQEKNVSDPCCGTGNFLLNLPDGYDFKYVFGNDIDKMSVGLCRINVALRFNVHDKLILYSHITEKDYIFENGDSKYDIIIGNPPWGYDFSESEKKALKNMYVSARGSSVDSYEVFVEKALSELNTGGILAFVLPESILNVKAHSSIRQLLTKSSSIRYLEYLGDIFDGVQCPSIIMKLIKTGKSFDTVGMTVKRNGDTYFVNTSRNVNGDYFNFDVTDEEYELLKKIESTPNSVTLKERADFALGIVTGDNKKYITNIKTEQNERIINGSDIELFKIKNVDRFIDFNEATLQQVAPIKFYRAKEKLLYKFISDRPVFAYDNHGMLSLNSANILIPHIAGLSMKYIMAVLNSGVVQFFFKKSFNSVKVLRSHLERIPIPIPEESVQAEVIRIVDIILKTEEIKTIYENYEKLENIISELFGLTENEYRRISESNKGK